MQSGKYSNILMLIVLLHATWTYATDCSKPPKSVVSTPEKCCHFPRLFKQNALDFCQHTEHSGSQCFFECIYAATELCRKRECDIRKALDYVDYVWPEQHDFKDVYKTAYRQCMNEIEQIDDKIERLKRNGCDPVPELLEICVHNKMITLCPSKYFNTELTECVEEREFLENCIRDV